MPFTLPAELVNFITFFVTPQKYPTCLYLVTFTRLDKISSLKLCIFGVLYYR